MIRKRPISTIMTEQVITLSKADSLEKASYLFKKHHIRHIPVVHEDELCGIVSYEDLMRLNFADAYSQKSPLEENTLSIISSIGQVMTKSMLTVHGSNTIREVSEIFSKREFHALPVVDNNKLVGMITTTDIIKYLLKQY